MKYRAVIENAIGETRAAVYEGRRLVELHLERESQKILPQTGDEYCARVTSLEPSLNGAFLDLGQNQQGFLTFMNNAAMPRLVEGIHIRVIVTRPETEEKNTTVKTRFPKITFDEASVSVLDDAVERRIALKGGGAITIDQTQALLAIDVGLGGLVIIDFPNLRQTRQRNQLFKAVERAFEGDKATVKVAPVSRFGCVELTRSVDYPSLDSLMNTRFGEPTLETQSLRALRQLEREALANRGAQFVLSVSVVIGNWLEANTSIWESDLQGRIGERFKLLKGEGAGFTVQADR